MKITKEYLNMYLYTVFYTLLIHGGTGNHLIEKRPGASAYTDEDKMLQFVENISLSPNFECISVQYAPIEIDVSKLKEYEFKEIK